MNHKTIIFVVLIFTIFVLILLPLDFKSSLAENLLAEIIGVTITVYLVDYFLGKDGQLEFKKLNENLNDSLLIFLRISIMKHLIKLEVLKKDEITIENIEELDSKLDKIINSGTIIKKIEEKKNQNQNTFLINILKGNYEILAETSREVEKFKPYPNYEIQNKIIDTIVSIKGNEKVLEIVRCAQNEIKNEEVLNLLQVISSDNIKKEINNDFKIFLWFLEKIKRAFLQAVSPYNFFYYGIVINKDPKKLWGEGFKNKESFYKYACGLVFENAKEKLEKAIVTIDESGNLDFKRQLAGYLRRKVNRENNTIRKVKMQRPESNNLLQLADYIAGVINRSINNNKKWADDYRKIIAHREIYVQIWPK